MSKILIIDDDEATRHLVAEFLERQGHDVASAPDGQRGLNMLTSETPDLILCDLVMPNLDGQGVVSALQENEQNSHIPVIFLSGCTDRKQIRQVMNLGGDDFLHKPIDLPEILEAINAKLGRLQRQKQRYQTQTGWATETPRICAMNSKHITRKSHSLHERLVKYNRTPSNRISDKSEYSDSKIAKSGSSSFLVKVANRKQFVKASEIKILTAYGEYSRIFWGKDQQAIIRKPLKQWEQDLVSHQFIRVHRQAIINLVFLDHVETSPEGKLQIHLQGYKDVVLVSQRNASIFNRRLKQLQNC